MDKNYIRLEVVAGQTIDRVVELLQDHHRSGTFASAEFNGVILYSDTVTLDNAYQAITGRTKAESEQQRQDWVRKYDEQKAAHEARIPELTIEWTEKGKAILPKEKWALWEEVVPVRLKDLYQGMELGQCLDLVQILDHGGTFEEAKAKLESQGHSGMSFSLICAMLGEFAKNGNTFVYSLK